MKWGVLPTAWDDANDNAPLRPDMVLEARKTEMEYFRNMGVYEVVPRSEVMSSNGKLIDTRWIDTNKTDEINPEYRSRLVGREYNDGKDKSLYASTPPIEALRLITSWGATTMGEEKLKDWDLLRYART